MPKEVLKKVPIETPSAQDLRQGLKVLEEPVRPWSIGSAADLPQGLVEFGPYECDRGAHSPMDVVSLWDITDVGFFFRQQGKLFHLAFDGKINALGEHACNGWASAQGIYLYSKHRLYHLGPDGKEITIGDCSGSLKVGPNGVCYEPLNERGTVIYRSLDGKELKMSGNVNNFFPFPVDGIYCRKAGKSNKSIFSYIDLSGQEKSLGWHRFNAWRDYLFVGGQGIYLDRRQHDDIYALFHVGLNGREKRLSIGKYTSHANANGVYIVHDHKSALFFDGNGRMEKVKDFPSGCIKFCPSGIGAYDLDSKKFRFLPHKR